MSLSVDSALKILREAGISFTAVKGEWNLQNLSLSSGELIRVSRILKERTATGKAHA
jgi:hypothetical protein